MQQLLEIKNLKTSYATLVGYVRAVDGVTLTINKKSAVGLVGESGCGKTSLVLSILKLLPSNAKIQEGQILFEGDDLVPKNESEMEPIRWKKISVVFQAAMNALNPVYRVGDQIAEAILTHENLSKEEAMERVIRRLELVGLGTACVNLYPHECSGGMKQRVMIAMALACQPELVILDEATTALDTIIQRQIIDEIKRARCPKADAFAKSSTTSFDLRKISVAISCSPFDKPPTVFMCIPGVIQSFMTTGVIDGVAVARTSTFRVASSAESTGTTSTPIACSSLL